MSEQNIAILSWIEDVARSSPSTNTDRLDLNVNDPTTPPSTSVIHHKRKRLSSLPGTKDSIYSPVRRPSSPSRVKAELASATPRVVYVPESADPKSVAATQLLETLQDSEFIPDKAIAQRISNASCQCATELRSEGSWLSKVALPLLEAAIAELPLECWNIATESVDSRHQPRYTAHDTVNRQVDLVVGLPVELWEVDYEQAGLNTHGKSFSHIDHPHTGKRIIGPGIAIQAADGNLMEAQVQLGVWMAGLLMWAFAQRSVEDLPPLVGCTVIGEDWKFYIAVGSGPGVLEEVRIWGPLSDLDGCTATVKHTMSLLGTLRRVMEYTIGQYQEGMFRAVTGA
ncbi:unnamed protein product [Penicillium salamii]|uniref:PD-(D/E)XK nuclease-like domain-containing protein n=1 Tax=Penicillium salamii TaxID=1612424 RepID=A0A9W4JMH3_9EURO|nr:unnamed protein product [Penicillium salamii]